VGYLAETEEAVVTDVDVFVLPLTGAVAPGTLIAFTFVPVLRTGPEKFAERRFGSGHGPAPVAAPYPPMPAAAKASSSVFVEETSETVPEGGSAITSPSAARNSVKCGVWKWA
jgi:hypothetical protein